MYLDVGVDQRCVFLTALALCVSHSVQYHITLPHRLPKATDNVVAYRNHGGTQDPCLPNDAVLGAETSRSGWSSATHYTT